MGTLHDTPLPSPATHMGAEIFAASSKTNASMAYYPPPRTSSAQPFLCQQSARMGRIVSRIYPQTPAHFESILSEAMRTAG